MPQAKSSLPSEPSKGRRRAKQPELVLPPSRSVPLARPLSLFGGMQVGLTAGLVLSPDTVLVALTSQSGLKFLRTAQPGLYATLRALVPAARARRVPRADLRARVLADLALLPEVAIVEETAAALDDPEYQMSAPVSPWTFHYQAALRESTTPARYSLWEQVPLWLAQCDEQLQYAGVVARGDLAQGVSYVRERIGPCFPAWSNGLVQLPSIAIIPVAVALRVLARVDVETARVARQADSAAERSWFAQLLAARARPMGHWLTLVRKAAGCADWLALHHKLVSAGRPALYQQEVISARLLARWAASREVMMPEPAVKPVLAAVVEAERQRLELNYFAARLLTFLCDLVRATALGGEPPWDEVQLRVASRYDELWTHQQREATRSKAFG